MSRASVPYVEMLREQLQNPSRAAAYLNAALAEDDPDVFLLALDDVAGACGLKAVAQESQMNEEYLFLCELLNDRKKLEDFLDYRHAQQVKAESSVRYSLEEVKRLLLEL